ncbi:MAG: segregation/condensation protein A, partial [Firmicutes bacterium]|nr:segregation/condensation protein A [Bacillota bacterium]
MDINIKLDAFEGPMELLLHLIAKNKMNIYDIPIAELTDQYLSCIDTLDPNSMESMSEFLVMAATLIEIKSRMLLPSLEDEEDEEEGDPREALVNRLIEYKRFKEMADGLDERQKDAGYSYYKLPDKELIEKIRRDVPKSMDDILYGADMDMLLEAFKEVMRRREVRTDKVRAGFNSVTREIFTIEDKIKHITNLLTLNSNITFRSVFRK